MAHGLTSKTAILDLSSRSRANTHYGWARLNVKVSKTTITATLTGYAYETIPNKPIVAGKEHGTEDSSALNTESLATPASTPATLGMLATGARGLSLWRREESPGATL